MRCHLAGTHMWLQVHNSVLNSPNGKSWSRKIKSCGLNVMYMYMQKTAMLLVSIGIGLIDFFRAKQSCIYAVVALWLSWTTYTMPFLRKFVLL